LRRGDAPAPHGAPTRRGRQNAATDSAAALAQCQARLKATCRLFGISDPTLRDKMKKYELKG
jgi:DNA-binding NtrC family response regulator